MYDTEDSLPWRISEPAWEKADLKSGTLPDMRQYLPSLQGLSETVGAAKRLSFYPHQNRETDSGNVDPEPAAH